MNSGVKVLIVDDELHNGVVLEKMLLEHFPFISEIRYAATVSEALQSINLYPPHIVFLDIQMHHETGFDLLQQTPDFNFEVIFVTAHDNYAIKAFRFHAVDYLLKPLVVHELKEAVTKAVQRRGSLHHKISENLNRLYLQLYKDEGDLENLTITTTEGFKVIALANIIYCQASSNYTNIIVDCNQKITSSQTLGYFEELLENKNFFRAHRSYLINLAHVRSYQKGEGGLIVMSNGDEVELSRNHKMNFMHFFKV
jgi:two-component system LytT family response regulator